MATFCAEEYPKLVGLLGLWCGDRAVAEELSQETLARVWQRWSRVEKLDNPHAWARRVALNLARSHIRRRLAERRARQRSDRSADSLVQSQDPSTGLALRESIARLSNRKRTALLLHYFLDLPFVEVAEIMSIPESTAKSLSRRGVQDLRKALSTPDSREAWDVS